MNFRFEIFKKNLRLLQEEPDFIGPDGMVLLGSSKKSKKSYEKGINDFIDFTDEEFSKYFLIPKEVLYIKGTEVIKDKSSNK